ncbi:MAG: hypothetical protein AAGA96_10735 [Verrucomicrobiota bacterium]
MEPTPEQIDELKAFLSDGRKIEAIQVFRDITGSGLAEAKRAIDRLESSGTLDSVTWPEGREAQMSEIQDLLRRRKKIEAIKIYRETTGSGLKDAREAVEEIEASMGLARSSVGCGLMITLLLVGLFGLAMASFS